MSVETRVEAALGDIHLDTKGRGLAVGALLIRDFDLVASVGNSEVNTTKQARLVVNRPFRIRGFHSAATAKAGTTNPTVDLFAAAATVLSAVSTLAAANTVYTGAIADQLVMYAAGTELSVRTVTAADGTITNLKASVEIELLPA